MNSMLLFIILAYYTHCIYNVPSYYGHFSRNYFLIESLRTATFRYFQYHYSFDLDPTNTTLYFVNSQQHCIQQFDLPTKNKTILAGHCGQSGNRIGGLDITLFNNPSSAVVYQENQQSIESEINMTIFIVNNATCELNQTDCILSDQVASKISLSMDNLRPFPPIYQFPIFNQTKPTFLYISDTDNHCIKKIDLQLKTTTIVAGQCQIPGFMDGPTGLNILNQPTNLGISRSGQLYFYDLGNQYMRKLNQQGIVSTLKNGACKKFGTSRTIYGYTLNNILCYDNWVELITNAPVQHMIDTALIDICTEHASKC